jgi:uncharacterized glyoxalase superfamily protein PhnB
MSFESRGGCESKESFELDAVSTGAAQYRKRRKRVGESQSGAAADHCDAVGIWSINMARIYRVILQVGDIDAAAEFYGRLLEQKGQRVSPGRHYFDCGGVILACFDPQKDGDGFDAKPNPDHIYLAVGDLEKTFERARGLDCTEIESKIKLRPWGERSFYAKDPFGNPICFVDEKTVFTG